MKILLVDDDRDDVDLFREALLEANPLAEYLHASNGQAAMDYLTVNKATLPDCIFLDVNMPVMSGMECLELIRLSPDLRALRVVIFSTSKFPGDYDRSVALGAEYWVKPSSFGTMVETLKMKYLVA